MTKYDMISLNGYSVELLFNSQLTPFEFYILIDLHSWSLICSSSLKSFQGGFLFCLHFSPQYD